MTGWLWQTHADVPSSDAWLSEAERARLAGLHRAGRRNDWRLGRWAAKRAVARFLGQGEELAALRALEILPDEDGAPRVRLRGRPASVRLSLSHRAGAALCCVAETRIALGCDLELVEPRSAAFVAHWFAAGERARVRAAPATERAELANLIWSAKESASKLLHQGLRLDPRALVVEAPPHATAAEWRPLAVRYGGRGFEGWWRRRGGWVLTLVETPAQGPPAPLLEAPILSRAGADRRPDAARRA